MSRTTVLADINYIIDVAMSERPEHAEAVMLFEELRFNELSMCVAATSLKDAYYILAKYSGEAGARGFICDIMDTTKVIVVDESVCREAAASNEPDFEDGIIRVCAERAGADVIITRDADAFQKCTIKSMTAREYLDLFCDVSDVEL